MFIALLPLIFKSRLGHSMSAGALLSSLYVSP